jgi:hypothetical protein
VSTEDDKWLHAMLQSAPAERTAACLDPDRLAAWSDGALDPRERADVELHVSTCGYCLAAVTALQRTAPATPEPHRGVDRARLFRWLVPITAAATAVAIWVAVNDGQRPLDRLPGASRTTVQAPGSQQPAPEWQTKAAPDTFSQAPKAENPAAERESARADSAQLRDEVRQRRETDTLANAESADLAAPASPPAPRAFEERAAPPPAASPTAVAPSEQLGATAKESSPESTLRRAAMAFASPSVSISPSDPSARWRVTKAGAILERSTDSGQTWTPIPRTPGVSPGPPAVIIASIRAVDERRAVATTSDRREFYTTDGGASWTLVQENESAPF